MVYEVENTSERPMTGQAVPSYGPQLAGEYFKKLECFCFTKQSFGPHEKRQMPVVFVIDSRLPADVNTITLSYTFFEVEGNLSQAAPIPRTEHEARRGATHEHRTRTASRTTTCHSLRTGRSPVRARCC